ncbi:NfeD family protein [Alkaliphilus peptidifermentans]|uniref:NfeD-like C-terminal, partner-binding n=1 Tax=Alkaliphilus peptidifermentans DSM 18978 TaxID=1120976 RepID=A0A1G5KZ49_9FIRM|nr:NfeD family protein [Alkaliphilus peptidifermentans]SCZ05877.1 NfeD-like C-terminal, partner-binding [Alkaliphilus peptidifermentans DSM 18978]
MEKLFDICFKTGLLFTVVSFILGLIFGGETDLGVETDLDIDIDLDLDTDIEFEGVSKGVGTVSPLKPTIIAAFVTVFGGVGLMVINKGYSDILALLIGTIFAFFVSILMYKLIIVPLHKRQTVAHSNKSLIGHEARVILTIPHNEMGKIRYVIHKNTYTAPAKALDDDGIITEGEIVIIKKIEKHIFYVEKK